MSGDMKMAKTTFENPFASLFENAPVDMGAFNDMFKNSAELGEKFSKVALVAAEKNAEIANNWTKDAITKLGGVAKAQADPADYSKAATDFASASVEAASEHVAAFAEVAKKVQMDTVELLMAAGKEAQAEATTAVKKATTEAKAAVKKATAKAA
jgi:phasin protein